jgi:hypothetical protein
MALCDDSALRYRIMRVIYENWLIQEIPTAPYLGSIVLFLLAFLGLMARPWDTVRF